MNEVILKSRELTEKIEREIQLCVKEYLSDEEMKKEFAQSILNENSERLFTQHLGFQAEIQRKVIDALINKIVNHERFEALATTILTRLETASMNEILMLAVTKLLSQK